MRSAGRLGHIAGVLAAYVCLVVLAGCKGKTGGAKAPEKPQERSTISGVAKGLELIGNDARGRRLYSVRTRESKQSAATSNATLTDTRVTLYHEGAPDIVVEAPNARVDVKSRELVMWGGLTAQAVRAKAVFRVDRMRWNAATKAFAGTGSVRYERAPVTMTSDRVSGKTPLTKVNLDGHVTMTVKAE